MKRFVGSFALVAALVISALGSSNVSAQKSPPTNLAPEGAVQGKPIPGQYIVVLKDGVSANGLLANMGIKAQHNYSAVLNGFAAQLNDQQLKGLSNNPNVAYIEQDQVVSLSVTQSPVVWGLDRIDQRARPLSDSYTYNTTAATIVRAYVIDTGLQTNHPEFGTRALNNFSAFGDSGADCHGHGTHVGGTIAGKTYGVAKTVRLRGIKVLDCNGSGSNSGVIAGMDWVRVNAVKPAVANMSLGGGFSAASNTAANNLANSGVFLAVAAGNENQAACNVSPASASAAVTVASSTSADAKSSFSNWGSCVDIYAPGSNITSAQLNGTSTSMSGTSMASPHVAGVAALYKVKFGDAATATLTNWIITNATANVITGNPSGTPNKLLYKSDL